jgi:hypothetical protein
MYIKARMEIHSQKVQGMMKQNVNTRKQNQDHQNNSNEVKNEMLKGHPLSQNS